MNTETYGTARLLIHAGVDLPRKVRCSVRGDAFDTVCNLEFEEEEHCRAGETREADAVFFPHDPLTPPAGATISLHYGGTLLGTAECLRVGSVELRKSRAAPVPRMIPIVKPSGHRD